MKRILQSDNWPESWRRSYAFDLEEVYGEVSNRGYAFAYANRRKHALNLIRRVAGPGARVLDVAAAQGNFSLALAEMGYRVTWNDLRLELAEYVKLKWEHGVIEYVPGNVFNLELAPVFDVVVITEIIEHVAHPDDFLSKVSRLVKPGGYIVMTTPNGGYFLNRLPKFSDCPDPGRFEAVQFKPDSDGHIFLLHEDEIPGLAGSAGLQVRMIRLFTNSLTAGHLKTGWLLGCLSFDTIEKLDCLTAKLPGWIRRRLHSSMAVLFQRPAQLD